jgi:hypothetical protein
MFDNSFTGDYLRATRARSAGVVSVVGAAMLTGLSQLVLAPGAHADPEDFFGNVNDTVTMGESFLTQAETLYSAGDYTAGLETDLAAGNYLTLLPTEEILLDSYSELSGGYPPGELTIVPDFPTDLSDAFTLAGTDLTAAQTVFDSGVSGLATGDVSDFLYDSTVALNYTFVAPTDAIIVGIAESLFNGAGPV